MKKMTLGVVLAFGLLIPTTLLADVHYVSPNGYHVSPFNSWTNAATNIQAAINSASVTDIVCVATGTYSLSASISITNAITLLSLEGRTNTIIDGGDLYRCLTLNSTGAVVDGFTITRGNSPEGGGGVWSASGGTIRNCTLVSNTAHSATISETSGGGGVYLANGGLLDNCRIVSNLVYSSRSSAKIAGVGVYLYAGGELTNCDISYNSATSSQEAVYGGGIYLRNGGNLRNCRIIGNSARAKPGDGGGVYSKVGGIFDGCDISSNECESWSGVSTSGGGVNLIKGGTLKNCNIRGNTAGKSGRGGGVSAISGTVTIEVCIIENNRCLVDLGAGGGVHMAPGSVLRKSPVRGNSAARGGGLFLNGGGLVDRCIVESNESATASGGIESNQGGTIQNSLICHNRTTGGNAGGIFCSGNIVIDNCTIYANESKSTGGGVYCAGSEGGLFRNTIIYDNTAPVDANYHLHSSGYTFTNCCAIPLITNGPNIALNPNFVGTSDYRLSTGSPCIDAGTNLTNVSVDLVGIARPLDGTGDGTSQWDIGAYEHVRVGVDTDGDGADDASEIRADTSPISAMSILTLAGITLDGGDVCVDWRGGLHATQYLERAVSIDTGIEWQVIFTNLPPTVTTTAWDAQNGDPRGFYRIRVP
jgi:hypothetical protein